MTYSNGILPAFIERKEETRSATVLRSGRKRAADLAGQLSKRGAMAAGAELVNEAVCKLISMAYEVDDTGLCNVDAQTGVFDRFPMPWGRFYQKYGLRTTERAVLGLHVRRLQDLNRPAPLFTYDPISRRWGLNIWDYGTVADALKYWELVALDGKSYWQLLQTVRKR